MIPTNKQQQKLFFEGGGECIGKLKETAKFFFKVFHDLSTKLLYFPIYEKSKTIPFFKIYFFSFSNQHLSVLWESLKSKIYVFNIRWRPSRVQNLQAL